MKKLACSVSNFRNVKFSETSYLVSDIKISPDSHIRASLAHAKHPNAPVGNRHQGTNPPRGFEFNRPPPTGRRLSDGSHEAPGGEEPPAQEEAAVRGLPWAEGGSDSRWGGNLENPEEGRAGAGWSGGCWGASAEKEASVAIRDCSSAGHQEIPEIHRTSYPIRSLCSSGQGSH